MTEQIRNKYNFSSSTVKIQQQNTASMAKLLYEAKVKLKLFQEAPLKWPFLYDLEQFTRSYLLTHICQNIINYLVAQRNYKDLAELKQWGIQWKREVYSLDF